VSGISTIKNISLLFPDNFFNGVHPDSPWVSVQFRNKILPDLNTESQWTEITLNPSNYFDNITITDESGFQNIELNLVDEYYTRIETAISRAIAVMNANNQLSASNSPDQKTKKDFFQFQVPNSSFINMRIRFGYGTTTVNSSSDGSIAIDETSFGGDYNNRVNGGTVIRSPWLYCQILNTSFRLTEFGLAATISAITTVETWLTKAKMLRKFYIFRDTPIHILQWLQQTVNSLSKGEMTVTIQNEPETSTNKDAIGQDIEINLGDETDTANGTGHYKTMKSFIDELCSKIPPKIYDSKINEVQNDGDKQADAGRSMDRTSRYSYMLTSTGAGKYNINFFYPDPTKNIQPQMRTYIWREFGTSIVKGFEVESRTDFAQLNFPMLIVDKTHTIVNPTIWSNGGDSSLRLVNPTDVSAAFSNMDVSFVAETANVSGLTKELPALVAQQIIHFLNQGVFQGTITLPGDPFFLFDNNVRPYEYMVNIIILRPGFADETGTYTSTTYADKSYLSGYYLVGKITHSISMNGFNTVLDIVRYPLPS
jgi:hypothetical protein